MKNIQDDMKNNKYKQIVEILNTLDRKESLQLLSDILDKEFDLKTASNIIKEDCEPYLRKLMFEDNFYDEGNEDNGFIELKTILKAVEEIVNCDDYLSGNINFAHFVRPETEEESKENGHGNSVDWWCKDDTLDINKLYIGFEG